MSDLIFELARREDAQGIDAMRAESRVDLHAKYGLGQGSGLSRLSSIRERIAAADPQELRRSTIYCATREGQPVGSVVVSTFPPGFWKRSFWTEPKAPGLGVFNLVVFPGLQRQGIGRFLMEGVERLGAEHGIPFVRLDAYVVNPVSTTFYRAIGYEERATINLRGCGLILFEKRVMGD